MTELPFGRDPDPSEQAFFVDRLVTERLELRVPAFSDATAIFDGWAQDPQVTRFLLWKPHQSIDETLLFLAQLEHAWREHVGHRAWLITERTSGEVVGMLGADYAGHAIELGYVLARPYWGRGYVTEAVKGAAAHAFGIHAEPLIERISAICHVENHASARVLEKAGFEREGRLRKNTLFPAFGPRAQDVYQWSVTRT